MSKESQRINDTFKLRQNVKRWARDDANYVIAEADPQTWAGFTPEQREIVENTLRRFAENAASDTLDSLNLHGHLTINPRDL